MDISEVLRTQLYFLEELFFLELVVVLVGCIMQSLDDEIGGSVEEGRLAEGAAQGDGLLARRQRRRRARSAWPTR